MDSVAASAASASTGNHATVKIYQEQVAPLSMTFFEVQQQNRLLWIPRGPAVELPLLRKLFGDAIEHGIHQPAIFPQITYVDGAAVTSIPFGLQMEDNVRYGSLLDMVTRRATLDLVSDPQRVSNLANAVTQALSALLRKLACLGTMFLDLQPRNLVLHHYRSEAYVAYLRIPNPHLIYRDTEHKYDAPPLVYVYMLCALYIHLSLAARTPNVPMTHQAMYQAMLKHISSTLIVAISYARDEYPSSDQPSCVEVVARALGQLETQSDAWHPHLRWPLSLSLLGAFLRECVGTLVVHVSNILGQPTGAPLPWERLPPETLRQLFAGFNLSLHFAVELNATPEVRTAKRLFLRELFLCPTRRLGEGTYNVAYAKDAHTVLRVPKPIVSGKPQNNRREVDAMQRLSLYNLHPAIRIPSAQDLDSPTLIVEMQRGIDLHTWLQDNAQSADFDASLVRVKLVTQNCVELMRTLACRGLFCADIKPANVLVLNADDLDVRIIDVDPSFVLLLDPATDQYLHAEVQSTRGAAQTEEEDKETKTRTCNVFRQWMYVCMLCLFYLHVHWNILIKVGRGQSEGTPPIRILKEVANIVGQNLVISLTPLALHTGVVYNSVSNMFQHLHANWTTTIQTHQGQERMCREDVLTKLRGQEEGALWPAHMFRTFFSQVFNYAWHTETKVPGLLLFETVVVFFTQGEWDTSRDASEPPAKMFECEPHMVLRPREGSNVGSCQSELEPPLIRSATSRRYAQV
jgi:hypothetical protein